MVIFGPVTPGQVSFLLGIVPVIVAWIYAEYLEHRKTSLSNKTFLLMDEAFLMENRLTLGAISKFGILLA